MLKIEDLKVGDELVCIDRDGFLSTSLSEEDTKDVLDVLSSEFIVDSIDLNKNWVFLKGDIYSLNGNELKHFKKKDQSKYTFDDLIDVAVQAFKDGLLEDLKLNKYKPKSITIYDINDYELEVNIEDNSYCNKFYNHIQSLYKETFVIECDNDVNKIKNGESVLILKNGKAFKFSELMDIPPSLLPDIIFGSTVEQSK